MTYRPLTPLQRALSQDKQAQRIFWAVLKQEASGAGKGRRGHQLPAIGLSYMAAYLPDSFISEILLSALDQEALTDAERREIMAILKL